VLEDRELRGRPRPVGRRLEVRPRAREPRGGAARYGAGCLDERVRQEPAPTQAGLDLQLDVERGGGRIGPQRGKECVEQLRIAGGDRDPRVRRARGKGRRDRIEGEDRDVDPGQPQRERFVDGRDAQAIGARGCEGRTRPP
jgi:hypothetical protein